MGIHLKDVNGLIAHAAAKPQANANPEIVKPQRIVTDRAGVVIML
jgi:hypothetical protein